MIETTWQRLAAPFSLQALTWRIVERAPDQRSARVRPQLRPEAVRSRFDTVLTLAGWSCAHQAVGDQAILCALYADGVSRSVVVALAGRGAETAADDAFVYAAEQFGLRPPADTGAHYWVDYDPDNDIILYEPEVVSPEPAAPPLGAEALQKSTGQQAIDRLIDRLKEEGLGLEVAKLVTAHGGYGRDPAEARELYARLRQLYKEATPS